MQKRFSDAMKELRGLISEWSAPLGHSDKTADLSVLLAVSGGIDSMCMAELFASSEPRVPFAIAHCNFRLRGDESDADERFVRKWAADHEIECHVVSFDTEEVARGRGISIEMAARDLRYEWFAGLCAEHGYKAVAVAHNANDNAETLLLNLLRGSGINGLSGMSMFSTVPASAHIPLLRPLLACTRKQIEGYMFAGRLPFREDSTNAVSDYKRNRIRNEVFPIFEKINPSFIRTLNREMGYFAEAGEIVGKWCSDAALTVVKDGRIDVVALKKEHHWKYLLYHILQPYGFNHSVLASIENLLESSRTIPGKRFEAQEYVLLTGRDELFIRPVEKEIPMSGNDIMPVRGAGVYHFNDRAFNVEIIPYSQNLDLRLPEGVIMMDAAKLKFPFVLRRWRTGDWMIPLGMRGKKKVSDLFTDLRYDALQKRSSVLVVDTMTEGMAENQHVAALAGLRIDDRYKVSDSTQSIVRISEIILR